nr:MULTISPECIES: molybdopterin-dependent oxidoreductase [unclassified Bradyrhizobium]
MKGRAAPELAHNPNRLAYPMRRTAEKGSQDPLWVRISWDDALAEIAEKLNLFKKESGAESIVVGSTTPSGSLCDSFEWLKRFAQLFGTPNFLGTTEICNWHKDDANVFTFGCPTPPGDHRNADVILLWGNNPANTWLAQADAIGQGRAKGAKLVVVDPRPTGLARQADLWLRVRPGTDGALALGIANAMVTHGGIDHEFVRRWTNAPLLVRVDTGQFLREQHIDPNAKQNRFCTWSISQGRVDFPSSQAGADQTDVALAGIYSVEILGSDGIVKTVECKPAFVSYCEAIAPFTPDKVEEICDVPAAQVLQAAEFLKPRQRISHYAWSGVGQHTNATQTARAIATLYALTGSFDQKGSNWVFATHPANKIEDYYAFVSPEQRAKALGLSERPLGPAAKGTINIPDLCTAILEEKPYKVRGLLTFGLAPHTSNVDAGRMEKAFRALEFHVHCDLFETPAARHADILLPSCSFPEREALRTGFEISEQAVEHIQFRPRLVTPRGESRPDYQIAFDLAVRLGMEEAFFGGSVESGWNYVLAPLGLDVSTLRNHPGGLNKPLKQLERKFALPNREGGLRGFNTPTARVELYSEALLRAGYSAVPTYVAPINDLSLKSLGAERFPFVLSSAKNGYYCHSQHRNLASLRKRAPYPIAELSSNVGSRKGISEGDWVRITTENGSARFRAKFINEMADDVVVAEFGWWQACTDIGLDALPVEGESNSNFSNLVIGGNRDPISGSSPLRSSQCNIERDTSVKSQPWHGFRDFRVTRTHEEAEGVRTVRMEAVDGGPVPDYLPGQHITVRIPELGDVMRCYSLVGSAQEIERRGYTISVRHVRAQKPTGETVDGLVSSYIHCALKVGQVVSLKAPSGQFVMPLASKQPIVLFAGGIGITPFVAYLETLADQVNVPDVLLLYANRSSRSHAYAKRIFELREDIPSLTVVNCYDVSDGSPDEAHVAVIGRMNGDMVDADLIRRRARFYFCGPEPMMNSITEQLVARGVPPFDIFREAFKSPSMPNLNPTQKFSVTFARSGKIMEWSPDKGSLLAFGESMGISMASGCRVGQCESCAVRVVAGVVEHMNGGGPDDPKMCLACQAIPASNVTIDA